eukprot:1155001-Pelagomonas_calceolata.AAC.2
MDATMSCISLCFSYATLVGSLQKLKTYPDPALNNQGFPVACANKAETEQVECFFLFINLPTPETSESEERANKAETKQVESLAHQLEDMLAKMHVGASGSPSNGINKKPGL